MEPAPNIETNGFFEAVMARRIADAETELDSIRTMIPGTESGRGYLKGLEGLLLTAKANDDKYLYLSRIEMTQKTLKTLKREFADHTKNALHSDYDRGYFQALEGFIRKLERSDLKTKAEDESAKKTKE